MADFSTLAQAGGTLFAAAAAGTSWLSVTSSQREARERRLPYLQASALPIFGTKPSDPGRVNLVVLNAGAGVANSAAFVLAVGDKEYCSNGLGSGFLSSQGVARVETKMRPQEKIRALVMCRDVDRRIWVYDLQGNRKSYKGAKLDPARDFQVFWSDFYGDDLEEWPRGASKVKMDI
ncbi:MAG TPA: hypothetical protein VGL57_01890 [Solirubrobacteraceae bacterium]|jgi:hypothetical protein